MNFLISFINENLQEADEAEHTINYDVIDDGDSEEIRAGGWTIRRIEDDSEDSDSNRQGMIRYVKNAHLVFKRQDEDGTFEELWVYNIGKITHSEVEIKKDILAGTDIEQGRTRSEDGSQKYEMWSKGDVQFLFISGLPN